MKAEGFMIKNYKRFQCPFCGELSIGAGEVTLKISGPRPAVRSIYTRYKNNN